MGWFGIILSTAPLWLSWLGAGGAVHVRQQPAPSDAVGEFVYRRDYRGPNVIKQAGGFRPQGADWELDEEAFSIDHHYRAGPNGCELDGDDDATSSFRTAYVSVSRGLVTSASYGRWVYEIRATPNILDDQWPESYPDGEVFALGGIPWPQVKRYARIKYPNASRPIDESDWKLNPGYDRWLYERPTYAPAYKVSTDFPRALSLGEVGDEQGGFLRRPLYHTAQRYVADTASVLVGSFPLSFKSDEQVPEQSPSDVTKKKNRRFIKDQVSHELQQFINMTDAQLNDFFPDGREMLRGLLPDGNMDQRRCAAVLRPAGTDKKSAKEQPSGNSCCLLVASLREKSRRDKQSKRAFRLSFDEVQRLIKRQFEGLNCAVLLERMKRLADPDDKGGRDNDIYIIDAPTVESNRRDCRRIRKMVTPQPTRAIFHADYLWPAEAKKQDGFIPYGTSPAFSAYNTFGAAARRAAAFPAKGTQGLAGVVYLVRATPNILVVNMTVPAVVGGIRWKQVIGWVFIPRNYTTPKTVGAQDERARERVQALFETVSKQKTKLFEPNPDYDGGLDNRTACGKYVNLEGMLLDDVKAFMNENGKAVGWSGDFPLLRPLEPDRSGGKQVSVPERHDEGVLAKIGDLLLGSLGALLALFTGSAALMMVPGVVVAEVLGFEQAMIAAMGRTGLIQMLRVAMV
ncbi:putative heat-labile enterotoxin [Ophiocordyceps camponoti-saundersi (nom. inval.)]|nr:putative heat-labile enterotoxin [Ophiocordyceps camponoti-saundersi (nom. inval.)]